MYAVSPSYRLMTYSESVTPGIHSWKYHLNGSHDHASSMLWLCTS